MPDYPLLLHAFRYRDPASGRWRTARYRATREEIEARYADYEIVGTAVIVAEPSKGTFNPGTGSPVARSRNEGEPR